MLYDTAAGTRNSIPAFFLLLLDWPHLGLACQRGQFVHSFFTFLCRAKVADCIERVLNTYAIHVLGGREAIVAGKSLCISILFCFCKNQSTNVCKTFLPGDIYIEKLDPTKNDENWRTKKTSVLLPFFHIATLTGDRIICAWAIFVGITYTRIHVDIEAIGNSCCTPILLPLMVYPYTNCRLKRWHSQVSWLNL